ncbi:hypothetical protein P9847_27615, partial [Paenibacillus chibensis]|nr:hypothetical protein [Paenibacillus chibensis]
MKEIRRKIYNLLLAMSLSLNILPRPVLAEESAKEVPEPDIAALQAAKAAVENTEYPAANQ